MDKVVVLVLIGAALAGAVLLACVGKTDPALAKQLVSEGALLVDVRSPEEFAAGHIDGAINVPVDALAGRTGELGDKGRAVVVYCRSGMRSASAKRLLERHGFGRVYDLGAMSRW